MLKFFAKMCIKVIKNHRIVSFKQDGFIRDYIEFNTEMRAETQTQLEKDIVKLMNNSLFGNSCENHLKHLEDKIFKDEYEKLKTVCKPTCKDVIRYDNYILISFYKKQIQYDKPIYLGSTVLELSKLHLIESNVLQPLPKDVKLHCLDTDIFELKYTEDNVIVEHQINLDIPIKTNNKIPGKLRHKFGSKEMKEFIVQKPMI